MIAQPSVNEGGEKRTMAHNRACSPSPPYNPPLYPRLCTPDECAKTRGAGPHSTAPAGAGRASETPPKDWEQAANICILRCMVRFPGVEPAISWSLARRAATWMREVQKKYPDIATGDYLLQKITTEYRKLANAVH